MQDFPLDNDWTGTAVQLAQVLTELLPQFDLDTDPTPSERLVRFYVASGALQRPQKEGREAWYGRRQALEFLATRVLLKDGWPLAKVAEYLPNQSEEALLALIPVRAPKRTRAQELVAQFKSGVVPPPKPMLPLPSPMPASSSQAQVAPPVKGQLLLRVEVAPWCEVLLNPDQLGKVSSKELERAVETFRATLEGELARKGRPR